MNNPLTEVKLFVYTNPQGLQLEVLFVLDPEKKGYINATAIAKQFDKEPIHWLRNQHTQAYIQELLNDMNQSHSMNLQNESNSNSYDNSLLPFQTANSQFGTNSDIYDNSLIPFQIVNSQTSLKSMSYDDLVITIHGGNPHGSGTWLHPKLAVIFARWLSPHFAVWCDKLIAELLHQHLMPQQQFVVIFNKLEENQRQFRQESNQRFQALEHRFEESINTIAQIFNNLHAKSTQDQKHSLGQIFNGINQLNKTLSQQQQADLLKPPVEVGIKQTLLEYQHTALKAQGWSWQRIAQELNARGTATVSGTGQWHGSSVKRYIEAH